MGKTTGFLEYARQDGPVREPAERLLDFSEFHGSLKASEQQKQGARCMDCGIPFCQAGVMISGMASGCPLHNLVPEMNDLVYRGLFESAYRRLTMTHSFPEFTSRVCPALCEAACTCGTLSDPVSTKENEKAVIEYAYEHGLVKEETPPLRTGKKVAVVGSGPSGLAAAQLLNQRGHEVTVFERRDRCGGLLRYGIPNMKLDKSLIDRRLTLLEEAGVRFVVNTDVGRGEEASALLEEYDSVLLTCGASQPRDISAPGRELGGIRFAVDFLSQVTKELLDSEFQSVPASLAKDKDVIVIGGGDTGNDCVGTCIRLGARSVTQVEMMPEPAKERLASNPWPEWPRVLKVDYGQEESIYKFGRDPRIYQTTVKEFVGDEQGNLKEVVLISLSPQREENGRLRMVPVEGSEQVLPAQLLLIAAGFVGCENYVAQAFEVERDQRGNVKTDGFATSRPGVYAAGDMRRGQSLVVWAISEGRAAARAVDEALMGYTNLT